MVLLHLLVVFGVEEVEFLQHIIFENVVVFFQKKLPERLYQPPEAYLPASSQSEKHIPNFVSVDQVLHLPPAA